MKHNLATDRPSRELLSRLIDEQGLENVFSTRSPTYKQRGLDVKKLSKKEAIDLMLEEPNLMRRPLVLGKNMTLFGYDAEKYDLLK